MQSKILVAIVVIVAVGAFFGGMKYQQAQGMGQRQLQFTGGPGGQNGGFGRRFGGAGSNAQAARGQVVSLDSSNITLKLSDGSTKLINLSGSTSYMKADKASANDIKTGTTIMVFGTTNSDGSITAQNVQLNPMTRPTK
jgi:hypothetical protein